MARKQNNMGSIRQRPDGRWEGRYSTPDGRQRSVYGKTQKECAQRLKLALVEVDTGAWLKPSALTVGEWLEIWLRDYQSHTTGRTVETYRHVIDRRFVPVFGAVRLTDLSQIHVRRMVNAMKAEGLAASTIRHACGVLSAAMNCAVSAKLIRENPVSGVKRPKLAKSEFCVIDRPQIPRFVELAGQDRTCAGALVFLLQTGMRCGEMCGLRWEDVDLDRGRIAVRRQLYAPSHARAEFRPPKNDEQRELVILPETVAMLRAHRKAQLEQRVSRADWRENDITRDLVFRSRRGDYLTEHAVYMAVKKIGAAMGLPDLRPHDLRHSYAVAALRSGVDVKTVQHNLGHKSASITLDIYASYTQDMGQEAAQKLSAYWKSATDGK